MSDDWRIRLARGGDAEAMSKVEADAAALFDSDPTLADITLPPPRDPNAYRAIVARGHSLVVEAGDSVVGFAACRAYGRELHLHELSVAVSWQGKGIGAALLEAVAIDARNAGMRAVTLETFIDVAWNAPFYARHGFELVEDVATHPRLAVELDGAVEAGLPRERRCAMIRFIC